MPSLQNFMMLDCFKTSLPIHVFLPPAEEDMSVSIRFKSNCFFRGGKFNCIHAMSLPTFHLRQGYDGRWQTAATQLTIMGNKITTACSQNFPMFIRLKLEMLMTTFVQLNPLKSRESGNHIHGN